MTVCVASVAVDCCGLPTSRAFVNIAAYQSETRAHSLDGLGEKSYRLTVRLSTK